LLALPMDWATPGRLSQNAFCRSWALEPVLEVTKRLGRLCIIPRPRETLNPTGIDTGALVKDLSPSEEDCAYSVGGRSEPNPNVGGRMRGRLKPHTIRTDRRFITGAAVCPRVRPS
jgi:hypothetical protein